MGWVSFLQQASAYVVVISALSSCFINPVLAQCKNAPVIFNFGDSNSDTGGLVAGLGYPINLPNGRTFFRRSTGRLSDGRLILDFLCKSHSLLLLFFSFSFPVTLFIFFSFSIVLV